MDRKPGLFYGWIIVLLGFMSVSTYGLFYSYGVFLGPLEAELQTSRTAISGVYTMYMLVYGLSGIGMGLLNDRYGPRRVIWLSATLIGIGATLSSLVTSVWQLYLFFGLIASVGHGAVYVVPVSTINRWFVQKRATAVGIAICGTGFGLLVVPQIAVLIINTYGWRMAFVALGVLFFAVNGIVGTFIRARPEEKGTRALGESPDGGANRNSQSPVREDSTVAQTIRTRSFWVLYLVSTLGFGAEQMVVVHVVSYGATLGIATVAAGLALSFLGAGSMVGRLTAGVISDNLGRVRTLTLFCVLLTLSIVGLMMSGNQVMLYAATFLVGLGYAGVPLSCSVMMVDLFGLKNAGTLIGIWFTSGVPAGILGPLVGGIVFDSTGSYFAAFLIAGATCIVATVLTVLVRSPRTSSRPR